MAHGKYKGLNKSAESEKVLRDKIFKIGIIQNMIDIKED